MFHLSPVGSSSYSGLWNFSVCCGSEDLISVCKAKINKKEHCLSHDGLFSWEEVECLGGCVNAPCTDWVDYFEDLDRVSFEELLGDIENNSYPIPGSRVGRFSSSHLKLQKLSKKVFK